MMLAVFLFLAVTICILVAAAVQLYQRFTPGAVSSTEEQEQTPGRHSAAFYQPMERLLSDCDFVYLASQKGATPKSLRKLRAERRRTFRKYLTFLSADFVDTTNRLREIVVLSPHSRGDLMTSIMSARIIFAVATLGIESRLLLHACGFNRLTISARNLTESLASMQSEWEQFARMQAGPALQ